MFYIFLFHFKVVTIRIAELGCEHDRLSLIPESCMRVF